MIKVIITSNYIYIYLNNSTKSISKLINRIPTFIDNIKRIEFVALQSFKCIIHPFYLDNLLSNYIHKLCPHTDC